MLILRGAYHLWPKRVAFRNDYCLACKAPRRSVAVRTFDVGHLFGIPLIPVGFWRHWTCTVCGRNPHARSRIKLRITSSALYLLLGLSVAFWIIPVDPSFEIGTRVCRIAAPLGVLLLLARLLRALKQPSLRKQLAAIPPAADTACPFCAAPLVTGTEERWSCPTCGVLRC